jgi:hypothetical protein
MPRKSKRESPVLDQSPTRNRRGRPRKIIAPEALSPFGEHEARPVKKIKSLEKTVKPAPEANRRMYPATSERSYTSDEVEFMNALAEFKRISGRTFPTCSEILCVLRSLGYEKVMQ